jgi:hypothetical protein
MPRTIRQLQYITELNFHAHEEIKRLRAALRLHHHGVYTAV